MNSILLKRAKLSDHSLLKANFEENSITSLIKKDEKNFKLIIYENKKVIGIIDIFNILNPNCTNVEIILKDEFNTENIIKETYLESIKYLKENTPYNVCIFKVKKDNIIMSNFFKNITTSKMNYIFEKTTHNFYLINR